MALKKRITRTNAAADSLITVSPQIVSQWTQNVTIDSTLAASALAVGYPMGYNSSTTNWGPWAAPDPTVLVVYLGTTKATGGSWGLTVNSLVLADTAIAFDATVATVVELLRINGYDITCTLTQTTNADDTFTLTFDGQPEIETLPTVTGVEAFTGETASTVTTTDGTGTAGLDRIRGFVFPEVVVDGITSGDIDIVVLTATNTVATATQKTPHGLTTGMTPTVSGATESKLNITITDLVVTSDFSYTYTVAAVSGGTVDSGAYTVTNDQMAVVMTKGRIESSLPLSLVDSSDQTALTAALKDDLISQGLIVEGLVGTN